MQEKIYTGSAVREIDRLAIDHYGHSAQELMEKAGLAAFELLEQKLIHHKTPKPYRILLLCGRGNNGGDGYVVGYHALLQQWDVCLLATDEAKSKAANKMAQRFVKAGGKIIAAEEFYFKNNFSCVVDALIGVGIIGEPRNHIVRLIEQANKIAGIKLALDVPSGVNADTGAVAKSCFNASDTISFVAHKIGLLTGPAKNYTGNVVMADLGIKSEIADSVTASARILKPPLFKKRPVDSHKSVFGHSLIGGGDRGMLGAVLLAGKAALRCGSGKVHIVTRQSHADLIALATPELMSAGFTVGQPWYRQVDALAIGPGLGLNSWSESVLSDLLALDLPTVLDADGLSLLAKNPSSSPSNNWVLTPHPGEAARLLDSSSKLIQGDRLSAAQQIAEQYRAVCVLKGAGTIIASSKGLPVLCQYGNSGMSAAGMGDVLTGMIVAFLGQGYTPEQAAQIAVYLHSASADEIVKEIAPASLIASDIINFLPTIIAQNTE